MKKIGDPFAGTFGPANGNGGKDIVMLDNALAMVDNVVSMKLGL